MRDDHFVRRRTYEVGSGLIVRPTQRSRTIARLAWFFSTMEMGIPTDVLYGVQKSNHLSCRCTHEQTVPLEDHVMCEVIRISLARNDFNAPNPVL